MTDEPTEDAPSGGSVPQRFRNALFWRWAHEMPKGLPSGFITTLYAMASAADPSGQLRFNKGKLITIRAIATGARVDIKDARRYVNAAIAAGVADRVGESPNGAAVLYTLLVSPFPDWGAAVAVLDASKRKRGHAAPWNRGGESTTVTDGDQGGVSPTVDTEPEPPPDEAPGGIHPPPPWGDTPPRGWGDTPPTIPGVSMFSSMTVAGGVSQAEVPGAGPLGDKTDSTGGERWGTGLRRCPRCGSRMADRPGRSVCAACLREEQ